MNTQHRINVFPVRQVQKYKLPALPAIRSNYFELSDGRSGYTGSILIRRVKNLMGIFYIHYGMFYGFDHNGTAWVIEHGTEGIVCIPVEEFQAGQPLKFTFLNQDKNQVTAIMKRASERIAIPYHARDNNCETFVNYSVFARLESRQSKNTENFADVVLTSLELYSSLDRNNYGLSKILLGLRTQIQLPRMPEMHLALEKMEEANAKINLNDFVQILGRKPDVTSKSRKERTTFYNKNRRFAISNTETSELFLKLEHYESPELAYIKKALTYPVPSLKGKNWIAIKLAHANRHTCLKLMDESYTAACTGLPKSASIKQP